MFKIVRIPEKLEGFFEKLEDQFKWDHFTYFRLLVLSMAFSWGRRNISNICRHLDMRDLSHRTRFNNFLNVMRWDPHEALRQKAYQLLKSLKLKKGDCIKLIIDDSKKGKRAKMMAGVDKIWDTVANKCINGHQYVKAILYAKGHLIPFAIRLHMKENACKENNIDFQKVTWTAAAIIEEFEAPQGIKVQVLFDSYYLCQPVIKACRKKGFYFVSTLKSNRNIFKNGRKLKTSTYGKNLFGRSKKQHLSIVKEHGVANYNIIDAGWMDVSKVGKVHVVFSRKNKDKKILGIVTNDPSLKAKDIVRTYDQRWSIEVFFKMAKQHLGLGQYQNLSYKAAVTHLHLVCFAYALLTHIAIQRECAKGKRKHVEKLSAEKLQNELRRIIWDDLTEYLTEFKDSDKIIGELTRLLAA